MRNLSYENEFCMQLPFHANKSHFHKNGFTLRLVLKQRLAQGNSKMVYLNILGICAQFCLFFIDRLRKLCVGES